MALIFIPIAVVYISQRLQKNAEIREDKMNIFKTLMASRDNWNLESVRALNIIDVVFSDDDTVKDAWKNYYDKVCIENPTDADLKKVKTAQYKLLETMANSLGYKDKVTWETIQNPYFPRGLAEQQLLQQEYQSRQINLTKVAENLFVGMEQRKAVDRPESNS